MDRQELTLLKHQSITFSLFLHGFCLNSAILEPD